MTAPLPYRVTLPTPAGPVTLDLVATSRAHAIASAQELTGLGRRAAVVRCCRLGDW
jgi:hypothetical protein